MNQQRITELRECIDRTLGAGKADKGLDEALDEMIHLREECESLKKANNEMSNLIGEAIVATTLRAGEKLVNPTDHALIHAIGSLLPTSPVGEGHVFKCVEIISNKISEFSENMMPEDYAEFLEALQEEIAIHLEHIDIVNDADALAAIAD